MMKLFKKKKSDNKLSTTMLQQENPLGSSLTIVPSTSSSSIKKPAPAKATNEPMIRSYTPPTLVMPKPRRVLTPTRAILAGYDNDKTQVEDEEEEQETGSMVQDYISPILLPTSHHGDSSLYKNTVNKIATMKQVSSSTAGSDDTSSRVYESALESLPDEQPEIDDVVEGDAESEQWLPSPELSNLNNFANLVVQSPHVPSVPDFKKRVPVKSSNASSATVTPPHLNKQPTPSASVSQTLLKQKEEQDILLQQLKQQVELMEKQRILDREEWSKKEQELLNHRQQMMETLIETKDQLTNVLKAREENKAREAYYQKQLQQQQLLQLQQQQQQQQQQQLQQQQLMQQQLQQQQHSLSNEEEEDADEEEVQVNPSQQQAHEYYQQQQHMASDEYGEERRANKMRPDEYARSYHSRSSSRASNHPSIYQQAPQEEGRKSAISRRNSNASNKSGKSGILNRCDPSPSATLVAPTPQQRGYSRRRAKSIESGKWHDDGMGPPVYEASQLYYHDNRPRRSRSVGRRPSSVVYNDYYDDDDVEDDGYDYYDASPRYSGKHAYHNDYYVQQQPIYTTSDLYPGDYYSPRHPFPPLQPQQMQYHPPPPPSSRQINAQRYVAQPRHYHYN